MSRRILFCENGVVTSQPYVINEGNQVPDPVKLLDTYVQVVTGGEVTARDCISHTETLIADPVVTYLVSVIFDRYDIQ